MQRTSLRARVPGAVLILILSGCFQLSRQAPQVQYFVLAGASQAAAGFDTVSLRAPSTIARAPALPPAAAPAPAPPASGGAGLTIGMRRIDLASYLSSEPGMVVRHSASRIDVSQFYQWAGELQEGINRAMAAHLAGASSVRAVDVAPWSTGTRHDFIVQLRISRFEGVVDSASTNGRVHVLAGWDIVRPLYNTVLLRGTTDDRAGAFRVGDYAALATQLDAALARVAREIATCLARFPNDSTPPVSCSAGGRGGR